MDRVASSARRFLESAEEAAPERPRPRGRSRNTRAVSSPRIFSSWDRIWRTPSCSLAGSPTSIAGHWKPYARSATMRAPNLTPLAGLAASGKLSRYVPSGFLMHGDGANCLPFGPLAPADALGHLMTNNFLGAAGSNELATSSERQHGDHVGDRAVRALRPERNRTVGRGSSPLRDEVGVVGPPAIGLRKRPQPGMARIWSSTRADSHVQRLRCSTRVHGHLDQGAPIAVSARGEAPDRRAG